MGKPAGHTGRRVKVSIAIGLIAAALLPAPGQSQIISQGNPKIRAIALTFDAGADRGYAVSILATLERDHVRASFGMTGKWAQENADLLRRMVRDGDQLINHTFDHRSFTGVSTGTAPLSASQRTWEVEQADRTVQRLTGHSTKPYFRFPYGDYDGASLTLLSHLGYRYVIAWTVDSLGWNHLSAGGIYQRCLALTGPGAIVLMHVGSQSQDALALQPLIQQFRRRGYRFETVGQLVSGR